MSSNNELNSATDSPEVLAESDRITLSGLLKVPWKVYHTSLLIEPGREELRSKTLKTTQMLMNNIPRKNKSLNVTFTRCPAIKLFDSAPPALMIEVTSIDELIYLGYFINCSSIQDPIETYESLPIHIVKAKASVAEIVNNALVKVFDFIMTPLVLNTPQLASLLAVFVKFADKEEEGSASLKYNIPGLPRTDCINTSIRVKDLKVVFDFYNESDNEELQPICRVFYEKVLNHFKRFYELDLGHAQLTKISFPDGSFTDLGLMRVTNEDVLYGCLVAIDAILPSRVPPPPPSSFPSSSNY